MKRINKQNGITLIALVITIIVMLILVSVTISMAINGNLFSYAGKGAKETEQAKQEEQELSSGRIQVDGVWYDSLQAVADGIPSENQFKEYTEASFKDGYLDENAYWIEYKDGKEIARAVVPKGFKVIEGFKMVDGEKVATNSIADGLVIQDEEGNEFVWIPVEKAIITESEITAIKDANSTITTDLEAVQNLINSGTYPMAVQDGENYKGLLYKFSGTDTLTATVYDWTSTSYREPANLSTEYDKTTNLGSDWNEETFQKAYDEMVKSVANNGGFYVGRYEIREETYTLEDGSTEKYAQSQPDKTALVSTTWYNMYKYESNYAKYNKSLGVTSEMIWGSQWDQMMIFVNGKNDGNENPFHVTTTGNRKLVDSSIETGANTKDQVANIFDLEGSRTEWTQEVSSTNFRVIRGGNWFISLYASNRGLYSPTGASAGSSSRATLYISVGLDANGDDLAKTTD